MKFLKPLFTRQSGTRGPQSRAKALLAIASVAIVVTTMIHTAKARPVTHPTAPAAKPAAKATGKQATDSMRKACAYIGKAAKSADKKQISPKIKAQQPFFAALRKTDSDIKLLSKSITARDNKDMTRSMNRTGKGVAELKSAYRLSGIQNAQITEGIKKLDGAYAAFRRTYGPEALRAKKGGPLTPAEKQNVSALQAKYQVTLNQLKQTRDKASKTTFGKSASNIAALTELIDSLTTLLAFSGDASISYYTDLLIYEEYLTGSWYGISSYVSLVDPVAFNYFNVVDSSVVDVYGLVDTYDVSFAYDSAEYWSYYDTTTIDSTESWDVSITDSEITTYDEYIDDVALDVSVDEYDITVGAEDVAYLDHDGDGIFDAKDLDDDNDGIADDKDNDDDGDGIIDALEVDTDGDGADDAIDDDDDNDGISDELDTDDDGDGIADAKEAADNDNDNDGIPNAKDTDDDNDGIPDAKDDDEDGDGIDNADDLDDDNDGVDDAEDADHDDDGDGIPDATDPDDDNDGTPDTADADDDGDGTPDVDDEDNEAGEDTDDDGTPDAEDTDDDNDGTPDSADADDDGDGTPDADEDDGGDDAEDPGDDAGDDGADDAGDDGDDDGGDPVIYFMV